MGFESECWRGSGVAPLLSASSVAARASTEEAYGWDLGGLELRVLGVRGFGVKSWAVRLQS